MATLPCENGGGSLNNPLGSPAQLGTNNTSLKPYVAPDVCIGDWQISGINPDQCARADQLRQESYVAEVLNISGAPINIFKLLGVHEQGTGSLLSACRLIGSTAYPGYPLTGINNGGSWRSVQAGPSIAGAAWIGADFGDKVLPDGSPEYDSKPKWTAIGSLSIVQANTPDQYAKQVKVEIADGVCIADQIYFSGSGTGTIAAISTANQTTQCTVTALATSPTDFNISATLQDGSVIDLGPTAVGSAFNSTILNFTISQGTVPYAPGDLFTIIVNYAWRRVGIFNLVQSPLPQTLNLQSPILVKAVRIIPTLFSGSGNWEISALDILDRAPTDINNIQDLFFNENRDRDYAVEPLLLKAQYSPTDSMSDLSKFGLSILDQYSFNVSFVSMVKLLGRPIVVGDIVEVIPEIQYDQNLRPTRKFLEVTDAGWSSDGFSTQWRPTVYRFSAQQALPSQETRDIFGTLDTQKYLVSDSILSDGVAEQLVLAPLDTSEEIAKLAADAVPEIGSDDQRHTIGQPLPPVLPSYTTKGQPPVAPFNGTQGLLIEDGLPPNGLPYTEGFSLPDATTAQDGDYFRLNYPPAVKIPARLYRFSAVKNRWIYQETDRRGEYSSHRPSVRNIIQSDSRQSLGKKIS